MNSQRNSARAFSGAAWLLALALGVLLAPAITVHAQQQELAPMEPMEPLEDSDGKPAEETRSGTDASTASGATAPPKPAEVDAKRPVEGATPPEATGSEGATEPADTGNGLIIDLGNTPLGNEDGQTSETTPATGAGAQPQAGSTSGDSATGSSDGQPTAGAVSKSAVDKAPAEGSDAVTKPPGTKPPGTNPPDTSKTGTPGTSPPAGAPAGGEAGTPIVAPPSLGVPVAPSTGETGMPVWLIAVLAGVAVVIIAALVFMFSRKRSASEPAAKPAPDKPKHSPKSAPAAPAKALKSTPGRRPAILRDLSNATGASEHQLIADAVQIGRAGAQSDDMQSIVVKMNTVGRRHAVIEYRHHTYWLVDQGSLNGTYLNGERIHRERALNNGAKIQLESAEFEFVMPDIQDMDATASVDPGEFIETLVAKAEDAEALMKAAMVSKQAAETMVDPKLAQPEAAKARPADAEPVEARPAPSKQAASPRADTAVDDEELIDKSKLGGGTVDFDVFGGPADDDQGPPGRA